MQDPMFQLPTEAYCQQLRTQYDLTMPVLIDDGTLMSTLDISPANHWNIVTTKGAEIVFKQQGKITDGAAKAKVEELLE